MSVIGKFLIVLVATAMTTCVAYQAPSGRGYDYDRGRAIARSDIRAERFVYYAGGSDADRLVSLSRHIEANCGFMIKFTFGDRATDIGAAEFAEGYNSVSAPAIEERLGTTISEGIERCASKK